MRISVVIPAHNEERYLPACFEAIRAARAAVSCDVETVVVLNRYTVDFAKRLRAWGWEQGKEYRLLRGAPLVTSSRKFDRFGDRSFFAMMLFQPLRIRRSLLGKDTAFVDEYFFDFNGAPSDATEEKRLFPTGLAVKPIQPESPAVHHGEE